MQMSLFDGKEGCFKHPAKYSDVLLPYIYEEIKNSKKLLDPFAGTGKIAKIKNWGYNGEIYANDIEKDWLSPNVYGCDYISFQDAEYLEYPKNYFDAIATSPTYGNRMADHFNSKENSRRITYTHYLGKELQDGNTGKMHFGAEYKEKHKRIYKHLYELCNKSGKIVVNISNFIKNGEEVDVVGWTTQTLKNVGFVYIKTIWVKTPRMKFGKNSEKRVEKEAILVFEKICEV